MTQKEWLSFVLNAIENKFQRGSYTQWKHKDYVDLSQQIVDSTKVFVSVSTLKRIFGTIQTNDLYFPHRSTLKGLKTFAEVILDEPFDENLNQETENAPTEEEKKPTPKTQFTFKKSYGMAIGVLILIVGSVWGYQFLSEKQIKKIDFKLIKTDFNPQMSVQNSNFYFGDFPENDTVFLANDQGNRKIQLNRNSHQVNFYMYIPGLYRFFLVNKKGTVLSDSVPVMLSTNGWKILARYYGPKLAEFEYNMPLESCLKNNVFHPSYPEFNKWGIDTTREILWQMFHYKTLSLSGDNFKYACEVKNTTKMVQVSCKTIEIGVQGTKGKISLRLNEIGCDQYCVMELGEKKWKGATSELSFLTTHFSDWAKVEIVNQNKKVSIRINGKTVKTEEYSHSIGQFAGIYFYFFGDGYAKNIQLSPLNNPQQTIDFQ